MAKAEYRSAIRSRKLIKAALGDLLQEKPLDKITVTDVVNRAEINRGTFYAHYTDIQDVINHLIQQTFEEIRGALWADPQSLSEVPHALLNQVKKILSEDLQLYKKIMNSGAAPLMQEQLTEIVLDYLLQQEQAFAVTDHEQYVLTIRFCTGGLINLYRDWFKGKMSMTLDEITEKAEGLLCGIIANVM